MLINWLSIAKYGAILVVILGIAGSGFYVKSKIDSVETLKAQVATMAEQQKVYEDQVQKWANLDKRISDLETKRKASYAKTDKEVVRVTHTPLLIDTHLTPEQLCYWNDNGDEATTSACISKATSSPSP